MDDLADHCVLLALFPLSPPPKVCTHPPESPLDSAPQQELPGHMAGGFIYLKVPESLGPPTLGSPDQKGGCLILWDN